MSRDLQVRVNQSDLAMLGRLRPAGWRLLVRPIQIEETTPGGIALPQTAVEEREILRFVAQVVALGPECYTHPKFLNGEPWCEVGEWVVLRQYAGQEVFVRDMDGNPVALRAVNDDEILMRADSPDALVI